MPPEIIARHLNVREILDRRSCFLFGPRQTGKSTLTRQQFEGCPTYNLLDQALFVRLSRNPALIREALTAETTLVVIDEIQRMPALLNEVHLMIEEHGIRFLLTGSSARALRRKGVNLLGGRAPRYDVSARVFVARWVRPGHPNFAGTSPAVRCIPRRSARKSAYARTTTTA